MLREHQIQHGIWYVVRTVRYVGVVCFVFSCPQTSTDWIYIMRLVLHQQIYDETSAKVGLKIEPPLVYLWLLEMHVCWFLDWIQKSSQLKQWIELEDVVWSCLKMWVWCLFFNPHLTTCQLNTSGRLTKVTEHVTPAYMMQGVSFFLSFLGGDGEGGGANEVD